MVDAWTTTGGNDAHFPLSRLSLIARAQGSDTQSRDAAVREFANAYWKPLYAFARAGGKDNESAKDLVQGFFASLLERDLIVRFDPGKGRFRSYLRMCFTAYCRDDFDHAQAVRRGGGRDCVSIDANEAPAVESIAGREPSPEEAYSRAWARDKLQRAVDRLRGHLASAGDGTTLTVLDGYLDARNPSRPGYVALAQKTGLTETGVRHALEKVRRMLHQAILDELSCETATESEAQEELAFLMEWLGRK